MTLSSAVASGRSRKNVSTQTSGESSGTACSISSTAVATLAGAGVLANVIGPKRYDPQFV